MAQFRLEYPISILPLTHDYHRIPSGIIRAIFNVYFEETLLNNNSFHFLHFVYFDIITNKTNLA